MQLNYRGMQYQFAPFPNADFPTEPIYGKYRGSVSRIGQPVPRSQTETLTVLRYRGIYYVK